MIFAVDSILFAASAREAAIRRGTFYTLLAATWLIVAVLATQAGSRAATAGFGAGLPWWAYGIAQLGAVCRYLRLAVWPAPLIADYGRTIAVTPSQAIAGLVFLLGLGVATVVLLWRRSRWGLCGAWFFLILGPSSSVIPIVTEIAAEHRMYLPLIGVVVLLVAGAVRLGQVALLPGNRPRQRALGLGVLLLTSGALAAATYRRNQVYGSLESYWKDVAMKVPNHAGAHNNLGNIAAGNGDWTAAGAEYRAALAIEPHLASSNGNLGLMLERTGRPAEAVDHLEAALHFEPGNASWKRGLADARAKIGNGLAEAGRSTEAIAQYQAALELAPDLADVRNNLGGLLAESGRLREAEAQFAQAVRLQPGYREAQNNLRKVRSMQGLSPEP
jgi:Tfp pilus assembly protein PilF